MALVAVPEYNKLGAKTPAGLWLSVIPLIDASHRDSYSAQNPFASALCPFFQLAEA